MNERIKKLAEQADTIVDAMDYGGQNYIGLRDEIFAELIVKECINTVQKRYMGDNNREDMEVLRCVSELKNHFGVEE